MHLVIKTQMQEQVHKLYGMKIYKVLDLNLMQYKMVLVIH